MTTTLFIDVDDTLLDFVRCAEHSMRSALAELNLTYSKAFHDTFNQINDKLWEDMQAGKITQQFIFDTRWDAVFEKMGIEGDGVDFEKRFRRYLAVSKIPVEGAIDLLEYLSKKYRLCVVSNGPYVQQCTRLKLANMYHYFSNVFVSEAVGHDKPSTLFFNYCLAEVGNVDVSEIMVIGDSLTADIQGANNMGMQCCWYNHRQFNREKSSSYHPTFIVDSLLELKQIL